MRQAPTTENPSRPMALPFSPCSLNRALCPQPDPAPEPAAAPAAPQIDPGVAARMAVDQFQFTAPTVNIGPEPERNEWHMAAVGYPYWLWGTGGTTVPLERSTTIQGLTITMSTAAPTVTWEMGDGTTKRCGLGKPWTKSVVPGTPSPTCGHRYQKRGDYRVTATAHWEVSWTAGDMSGVLPVTQTSTSAPFHVGELQSLVVAGS